MIDRVRRQPQLPLDGADEEPEVADETGAEEHEPSYEVAEGESVQEAQDRIEAKYRARATSPLRAIRAFCVLCMGAQPREVANCTATRCVLYGFRDGTNPFQKRS